MIKRLLFSLCITVLFVVLILYFRCFNNLSVVFIIAIIVYLLSYRLSLFIGLLKNNKDISKLDLFFLIICIIVIYTPIFNINSDNILKKENRFIENTESLINEDNKPNQDFGKNFESWISDRFGFREQLIDLYSSFFYNISYRYYMTPKAYLDKKTKWEFYYPLISSCALQKVQNSIQNSINSLNKLNSFCEKNKIKLYILFVPERNDIYVEETYLNKNYMDNFNEIINEIIEKTSIPVVYPYKELYEAKSKNYVFYKTDHHWTEYGAFIAYKELIKVIKTDFPDIYESKEDDFNISQNKMVKNSDLQRNFDVGWMSYNYLNLKENYAKSLLNTDYVYYIHKNSDILDIRITDVPKLKEEFYQYSKGSNIKVLLIGTSMCENLLQIMPFSFKTTLYLRLNSVKNVKEADTFKLLKRLKQNILDYKPDIMILCFPAYEILDLKDLANED